MTEQPPDDTHIWPANVDDWGPAAWRRHAEYLRGRLFVHMHRAERAEAARDRAERERDALNERGPDHDPHHAEYHPWRRLADQADMIGAALLADGDTTLSGAAYTLGQGIRAVIEEDLETWED